MRSKFGVSVVLATVFSLFVGLPPSLVPFFSCGCHGRGVSGYVMRGGEAGRGIHTVRRSKGTSSKVLIISSK